MPRTSSPRPKMLVVRQPVKRVHARGEHRRLPVNLAIGVIATAGGLLILWLMGYIGYHLGYAPLIHVPELTQDFGHALTAGIRTWLRIPALILQLGLAHPTWLMITFVFIAIPAAGLSASRPGTPGGPRMSPPAIVFSNAAGVIAGLYGVLLVSWLASPLRSDLFQPLPVTTQFINSWYVDIQTVAGLDTLLLIAAALWTVLMFRLAIDTWLRVLSASVIIFATCLMIAGFSYSAGAAAQLSAQRSLLDLGSSPTHPYLWLGSTKDHLVTLSLHNSSCRVQLHNHPGTITTAGTASVIEFLSDSTETE